MLALAIIMVELRRNIKCSNCGTETNIYLSSELSLSELLLHGKCERCGNTLQLNYSIVKEDGSTPAPQQSNNLNAINQDSGGGMVNLDETLFDSEASNNNGIRELIEE